MSILSFETEAALHPGAWIILGGTSPASLQRDTELPDSLFYVPDTDEPQSYVAERAVTLAEELGVPYALPDGRIVSIEFQAPDGANKMPLTSIEVATVRDQGNVVELFCAFDDWNPTGRRLDVESRTYHMVNGSYKLVEVTEGVLEDEALEAFFQEITPLSDAADSQQ